MSSSKTSDTVTHAIGFVVLAVIGLFCVSVLAITGNLTEKPIKRD